MRSNSLEFSIIIFIVIVCEEMGESSEVSIDVNFFFFSPMPRSAADVESTDIDARFGHTIVMKKIK